MKSTTLTKNSTAKNRFGKRTFLAIAIAGFVAITAAFTPPASKLISKTGHINFFSHTSVEDISADNFKVLSSLDIATGDVVFSVPMQSFEFEKSLMQKHYNSPKFLDTKAFPKAKFKGKIDNLSEVDFAKDGVYNASVSGELTLHGITKPITEKGTITVKGNKVMVNTKMTIILADYEIAFEKGKPSTNIAKSIDATIKTEYTKQ